MTTKWLSLGYALAESTRTARADNLFARAQCLQAVAFNFAMGDAAWTRKAAATAMIRSDATIGRTADNSDLAPFGFALEKNESLCRPLFLALYVRLCGVCVPCVHVTL